MLSKQRLMAGVYLRWQDQWCLLERQGSRVVADGQYISTAGGHFENDELGDPKACMLRELEEETGLKESNLVNLSLRYICMRVKNGEMRINHYYFADLKDFPSSLHSKEGNLRWISEQELRVIPMPYSARAAIDHYLEIGHETSVLYIGVKSGEKMVFLPIDE
ncbi:MAG: NUDIX domain-containing protein [Firmicutes bacterium]|nr:NUDIX domain-containing protein [Bacillota bacterium]